MIALLEGNLKWGISVAAWLRAAGHTPRRFMRARDLLRWSRQRTLRLVIIAGDIVDMETPQFLVRLRRLPYAPLVVLLHESAIQRMHVRFLGVWAALPGPVHPPMLDRVLRQALEKTSLPSPEFTQLFDL